jgi:hypothetical protein
MYKNNNIIHERKPNNYNINVHYINAVSETNKNSPKGEYSLKQNFFDPTKNSPPNEFMIKLYMREQMYNLSYKKDVNPEMQ